MSNHTDQDVLVAAVEESREILGRYIEPGARDSRRTVQALLEILDDNAVIAALDRLVKRRSIRLVELD